jgi:maleylacetate reductase
MPRTLAEVGVSANQFPLLAENTMGDSWTYSNPRTIAGPEDIMAILEMAA